MRRVWLGIGWLFVGLAAIGTALPVMPTVPFLLVAAWAFARSSPALREKIRNDPRYGKMVRDWEDNGVVPRFAKVWAISAMTVGVGFSAWVGMALWIVAVQAAICLAVAAFLISRPERVSEAPASGTADPADPDRDR
ncbi:MAG: YbaN family protein [Paracoccus sp. (in: a-proteobacteria)]|uniref:YbaN family protein n=1 Tax=Paracoccus sp. TaxID=267 RepID=UPI0026DF23D6|nr:YbaN family protein [Paracoccus sp. (in: a-proteobacteria)]MDO5612583.1 YbaN family protein [Paracoccus sp. (in: a-proteobacteria)]